MAAASTATRLAHRSRLSCWRFVEQPVTFYRRCYKAWSLPVAFATCFAKGALADVFAQKVVEEKQEVDFRRNFGFSLWSGAYLGCVQHTVYNIGFTALFGPSTTMLNGLRKAAFEVGVHGPLFYLPIYYFTQDLLTTGSCQGHLRYYSDFWDIYKPYVYIWSWTNVVMFTVVPVELRIACMAVVSCIWSVVLSTIANRSSVSKDSAVKSLDADTVSAPALQLPEVAVEAKAVLDLSMSRSTILSTPVTTKFV